jgi:hypothetical protein
MPLLYELNTRCWLQDLSRRLGRGVTLATVPDSAFDEWVRWGVTHLWLMGVWTSGPRSREIALRVEDLQRAYGGSDRTVCETDIVGSPYAIAAYEVPDTLGGEDGLRHFRERLHQRGLKLVLDFVPNHLGLDHPWLSDQPELFVRSEGPHPGAFLQDTIAGSCWMAHGKDPFFAPWADTVQLDYRSARTRRTMRAQLEQVAGRCDGVRCDMAMLVLNDVFQKTWENFPQFGSEPAGGGDGSAPGEFWSEAIAAVKTRHSDFIFIAEVYWGLEPRLQSMGFDFTYNKEPYDDLVRRDYRSLTTRLLAADPAVLRAGVHFLENHDERRIAAWLPWEEHRAAALLILSLPGMRFLHDGQLTGARSRIPVQVGCASAEPAQGSVAHFYGALLTALKEGKVGKGHCQLHRIGAGCEADGAPGGMAITWRDDKRVLCVLVNLTSDAIRGSFPLPEPIDESQTPADLLASGSGFTGRVKSDHGCLNFHLPGWGGNVVWIGQGVS